MPKIKMMLFSLKKMKMENFPVAKIAQMTRLDVVRYSYFVDDAEKRGIVHLQNARGAFLEKFSRTGLPRTAPKKKLPRLTMADNILVLK